ncbi:unnamed protein product [Brachionus calyciflorus]|uniref:Uncharacterized protein n=1 Tax=Brachionus calyciflorus TaxID=104777 RepID=A0A814RWQ1_9BILA|nr:unnamed protein product [Brachionus calyciflorus]
MSQSNSKFKAGLKNPEDFKAFEALKNALVSAPVLAYTDFTMPVFRIRFVKMFPDILNMPSTAADEGGTPRNFFANLANKLN